MLDVELLINSRRQLKTANIFGFIAYSDRNPYIAKVLQDEFFWHSFNARSEGWVIYAIKPDSNYFQGGNAEYINESLGLKPDDYPQFVILSIGSDRVMMQRNYPLSERSVDDAYQSIKKCIDVISDSLRQISPANLSSTNVHREATKSLDAELASGRWKRVTSVLAKFLLSLWMV